MVRFAHIADVHLGGWKQKPMQDLNFQSFEKTVDICIKDKLDFVLFAGDLFDSAYPPIEILKETFAQFRKLKDAKIPCFIIAGSHDYSVSGKTFLDVLEKAGFCKNIFNAEEKEEEIILNPHIHENIAIYGYPGKKSGLEVPELSKIRLNEAPGMFKILMLHTTLDRVVGNLPIESLSSKTVPKADYYALGHIHVLYNKDNFVYPGPLFPNNFKELEDLKQGHFVIVDTKLTPSIQSISIPTKKIENFDLEVNDSLTATDFIILELEKKDLLDKIILLRVKGELQRGKLSDIKFQKIEEYAKSKGAYFLLKNIHDLKTKEEDFEILIKDEGNIEEETINVYSYQNPSDFNKIISELVDVLSIDKQEDEKTDIFNNRLLDEARRVLKF
jgi:DNA repair protein SbcD/Mre11